MTLNRADIHRGIGAPLQNHSATFIIASGNRDMLEDTPFESKGVDCLFLLLCVNCVVLTRA
jgi:hypothetical protein